MKLIKETKKYVHIQVEDTGPNPFTYKMPKISIKDKIKMYYQIRRSIITGSKFNVMPICLQIQSFYIKETAHVFSYMHIEFIFPEFYKYKPVDIPAHHLWWNADDIKTRTKILTEIINELKTKLSKHGK